MAAPSGGDYPISMPIRIELSESIDPRTVTGNVTVRADGDEVALGFFTYERLDSIMTINPIGVLPPGSRVEVTLAGGAGGIEDLAGNPLAADVEISFTTESAPSNPGAVLINEICADPQQDWDDSDGGDGVA